MVSIIIHKYDKKIDGHKATAKFDSWDSLSLLLSFAKDGLVAYNEKSSQNNKTEGNESLMYLNNLRRIAEIERILEIEKPSGSGLCRKDLQGVIEADL